MAKVVLCDRCTRQISEFHKWEPAVFLGNNVTSVKIHVNGNGNAFPDLCIPCLNELGKLNTEFLTVKLR